MPFIKRNKSMKVFIVQAILVTLVLVAVGGYVKDRFKVGFGGQKRACLPWDVYLIDSHNKNFKIGSLVAFIADDRMEPKFHKGTTVIKQVAGQGGDSVHVDAGAHYIVAGANYGVIEEEGAAVAQQELSRLLIDETIPANQLSVIGTLPRSFDSRYWGYVQSEQIIGRAYGIY